jgi:hypothetical protein
LKVPSIRALKELPQAPEANEAPAIGRSAAEQTPINARGACFAAGLLVALASVGVWGWNGYIWSQIETKDQETEILDESFTAIDNLGAGQLYDTWRHLRTTGIGEYSPPYHVLAQQASRAAATWALCGAVGLIAGAGLMAYGFSSGSAVRRKT